MKFTANRTLLVAGVAATAMFASACSNAAETPAPEPADAASAPAQDVPMVGGAAMYPNKTIVENAVNSADHTTLVAAVTAAGLVETLSGPGPFTVFAPTDAAFAKLPAGTVESLVQPANKATLTRILTYHVVSGRIAAADLIQQIQAGGGSARLTTVEGGTLTASLRGSSVILTDEKGGEATVTQADVFQSNGVIHVTDTVSMPD
ncbi:fasciclin domain-containing protein [Brevundimonas basaltis]|uniref:Putative surface protein with fasciclin (FAS1) repeats n=1 Tax=Brevundimonas basaltis TaxID=472166 RepID=A0A7W8MFH7_9CAUL|nr:fasciclin domain-containing protein [Brevundimonas basaltis]MBB5290609.1 putative surface protein with fasciclin (FAS1) repeats [Brevundimonas basaltis]